MGKRDQNPVSGKVVKRFPPWLKKNLGDPERTRNTYRLLRECGVDTICRGARCPNVCECYAKGEATFLILGNKCTRRCAFCGVESGSPAALDPDEASRVARAVDSLELRHAVITSVTRDDLPDGGAAHFARCISEIKRLQKSPTIEVLTPDFGGREKDVQTVCASSPDVFAHNIETVPRLFRNLRPQADFARSLSVLECASELEAGILVKSGFMVGLGETRNEVFSLLEILHDKGVDICTIGQYLQPTASQAPVMEYVKPEIFREYEQAGIQAGLAAVIAGPFVRSSYRAGETYREVKGNSDS